VREGDCDRYVYSDGQQVPWSGSDDVCVRACVCVCVCVCVKKDGIPQVVSQLQSVNSVMMVVSMPPKHVEGKVASLTTLGSHRVKHCALWLVLFSE
jgi:hypothetical protein